MGGGFAIRLRSLSASLDDKTTSSIPSAVDSGGIQHQDLHGGKGSKYSGNSPVMLVDVDSSEPDDLSSYGGGGMSSIEELRLAAGSTSMGT